MFSEEEVIIALHKQGLDDDLVQEIMADLMALTGSPTVGSPRNDTVTQDEAEWLKFCKTV